MVLKSNLVYQKPQLYWRAKKFLYTMKITLLKKIIINIFKLMTKMIGKRSATITTHEADIYLRSCSLEKSFDFTD